MGRTRRSCAYEQHGLAQCERLPLGLRRRLRRPQIGRGSWRRERRTCHSSVYERNRSAQCERLPLVLRGRLHSALQLVVFRRLRRPQIGRESCRRERGYGRGNWRRTRRSCAYEQHDLAQCERLQLVLLGGRAHSALQLEMFRTHRRRPQIGRGSCRRERGYGRGKWRRRRHSSAVRFPRAACGRPKLDRRKRSRQNSRTCRGWLFDHCTRTHRTPTMIYCQSACFFEKCWQKKSSNERSTPPWFPHTCTVIVPISQAIEDGSLCLICA